MTLEEEKKLVAEKLMGVKEDSNYPGRYFNKNKLIYFDTWLPESDRNQLAEVEEKLNDKQRETYVFNLMVIRPERTYAFWWIKTVPPEICWRVLIKTLREL